MEKLRVVSREEAELEMPQAINCMDFFNRAIFKGLPDNLKGSVWVAGGALRDYFLNGNVSKDFDIFSKSRKDMANITRHLRNSHQFKHYLITKNAIKGYCLIRGKRVDVDIVKKEFINALDTIDAFDFTVCCFATDGEKFYYHVSAPFDLLRKKLVIHSLPHPVDTLKRLQKYIFKGFSGCNGTILTIAKAIAEKDPNDESIFEFYKFD